MTRHDFIRYIGWADDQLCRRLAEVGQELADRHEELAVALVEEHMAAIDGYAMSDATSDSARARDGKANARDRTAEVFTAKGDIAALETEQRFLELLLRRG